MFRKFVSFMCCITILILCSCTLDNTFMEKEIVILYTGNIECALTDNIGYDGLAAYKKQLEDDGDIVLTVDSGNFAYGNALGAVSKGKISVDIMNKIGYIAAVPGSNEFACGKNALYNLASEANFSLISCNYTNTDTSNSLVSSYIIKKYENIKIAFIGISDPYASASLIKEQNNDLSEYSSESSDSSAKGQVLYKYLQKAVDDAKFNGAKYIIVLSNINNYSSSHPWSCESVIKNTYDIDAFIDGSAAEAYECKQIKNNEGATIPLSSAGSSLKGIGKLLISKKGNIFVNIVDNFNEKNTEVTKYITNLEQNYNDAMSVSAGTLENKLSLSSDSGNITDSETNLGDFCADALKNITKSDLALIVSDSFRSELNAGTLTSGDLMNVFPFGNYVTKTEMTGKQIIEALEFGVMDMPKSSLRFLQVSGINYEIDTTLNSPVIMDNEGMFLKLSGSGRVKNVKINGTAIDESKNYTVAALSSLSSGNLGFNMFSGNNIYTENTTDYSAIEAYLKIYKNSGVDYSHSGGNGRIKIN